MKLTKQSLKDLIKEESDAVLLETYISSLEEKLGRKLTEEEINEISWKDIKRRGKQAALAGGIALGGLGGLSIPGDTPAPTAVSDVAEPGGEEGVKDLTGEGSFKSAFALARDLDLDKFKYRGKLFNTKLAKKAKKKTAEPAYTGVDLAKDASKPGYGFSTGQVDRPAGSGPMASTMYQEILTKDRLEQIVKEELEIVLTDDEAKEFFGINVLKTQEKSDT